MRERVSACANKWTWTLSKCNAQLLHSWAHTQCDICKFIGAYHLVRKNKQIKCTFGMRAFLGHIYLPWKKLMHFIICVCAFCTYHLVPSLSTVLLDTSMHGFATDQYICNAINWIQRNVCGACVRVNGQMFVCSTKRKNLHTVLWWNGYFISLTFALSFFPATSCAVSSSVNCFIRF